MFIVNELPLHREIHPLSHLSSSVDLTAGLRRDELGWLPPRLTFDADGRSLQLPPPIDHRSASNVSLGGSHPNSSRRRPAVRSTEEEVRAIFRPARTYTSNFTRTRYFACASYLTSRHSANSLSIVIKVDTLINGGSCSWGCRRDASRMRLNCSSVSRLLNASLDAASLHVQARKILNIVTSHAFVIH